MEAIDALAQARRQGRRVALVTVLAVEGDAPSHTGAKLLADASGPIAGTLGCSEFDAAGLDLARQALDGRRTVRERLEFPGHGRERAIELFAEVSEPEPGVTVVGANPVGHAIADVAIAVGRRVRLLAVDGDVHERPGLDVVRGDPVERLRAHPLAATDAAVVSDHDAPWVDDVLQLLLASDASFVGMLGSRRHAPDAVARLRGRGVDRRQLARLHSPCGLDIGSRTPGEIALSIVAEIVAVERGRDGGPMTIDWSATD
jgi:xanthine dehydrogenase accessory factor